LRLVAAVWKDAKIGKGNGGLATFQYSTIPALDLEISVELAKVSRIDYASAICREIQMFRSQKIGKLKFSTGKPRKSEQLDPA
jgi:hypothetical protein